MQGVAVLQASEAGKLPLHLPALSTCGTPFPGLTLS